MTAPLPTSGARALRAAALAAALLLPAATLAAPSPAPDDPGAAAAAEPLTAWLLLGPVPAPLPAFVASGGPDAEVESLLTSSRVDLTGLWPAADDPLPLPEHPDLRWRRREAPDGRLALAAPPPGRPGAAAAPAEAWLAVYLAADRWQEARLGLRTAHLVEAHLDGEAVALAEAGGRDGARPGDEGGEPGDDPEPGAAVDAGPGTEAAADAPAPPVAREATLALPAGKHLLVLHLVRDPGREAPWDLAATIAPGDGAGPAGPRAGLDPARGVDIDLVLDAPRVDAAAVSPDGELVAVSASRIEPDGRRERWLEVRRLEDGALLRSWRGELAFRNAAWLPGGRVLSYTTEHEGRTTIWRHDLDSGATVAVVEGIERFGRCEWGPRGDFLVYSFTIEAEKDERGVRRILGPADRQPWFRDRSQLVQVSYPGGASRRLTAGPLSAEEWRLAPDGRSLLLFRGEPDLTERPYRTSVLCRLDLTTLVADTLLQDRWIEGAVWSPDGRRLALRGSPSAFDGLGRDLPDSVVANDYGGELYLYDLADGEVEPVSRDFDPTVQEVAWSAADGRLYATCLDSQFVRLYSLDPRDGDWRRVRTGLDAVAGFDLASGARAAAAWGTMTTAPSRLVGLDLRRDRARLLLEPARRDYRHVTFGRIEPWVATLPDGQRLDGYVYYPRDFDPERRYPCIVYYYGGTYPITRDFGGRYPKNVWAAEDYVVYVPEPSGALGYGQEYAARHVNDWGERTAREVIEGTRAFLAAHPFVDPERVGCIGASYGGFLTMSIVTKTDLFAAAISHAGISGIASYWGEGLWGYAYGARALAGRFPWSDPDLYVGRSPLFSADRITTPLLLLHGTADTNVPPGESDQLFTALKLLGRDVEYVQIVGQNHHILDHDQRIVWNDTILAYFARYLKGRPEWWDHLYPEAGAPASP